MKFTDFFIDERIKEYIISKAYCEPTSIQKKAFPLILEKKDVLAIAPTGSGKTDAYLLPILELLCKDNSNQTLILVPTRELVKQIEKSLNSFSNLPFSSIFLYGDTKLESQSKALEKEHELIIATPGRMAKLLEEKAIDISKIKTLVIDEVDLILEQGSESTIKLVLKKLPFEKQMLFFSATSTKQVEEFCEDFLEDHELVQIEGEEIDCEEYVAYVNEVNKMKFLSEYVNQREVKKVLVFVNTKLQADNLKRDIGFEYKVRAEVLHSAKSTFHRTKVMTNIHAGKNKTIITTDLGSRGIDIEGITHIVHYDVPVNCEIYEHRRGRTSRAGKKGTSILFSSEKELIHTKRLLQKFDIKLKMHAYHSEVAMKGKQNKVKKIKGKFKKKK